MIALVNTLFHEEVLEDIYNTLIINLPLEKAEQVYEKLLNMATDGATEEFLYDEMRRQIDDKTP
jgi:hypothetical protein